LITGVETAQPRRKGYVFDHKRRNGPASAQNGYVFDHKRRNGPMPAHAYVSHHSSRNVHRRATFPRERFLAGPLGLLPEHGIDGPRLGECIQPLEGSGKQRSCPPAVGTGPNQYFVTSHHDDEAGVLQTYSFRSQVGLMHLFFGFPVIVRIIDAVISGVVAAIATQVFGGAVGLQVAIGFVVTLVSGMLLGALGRRRLAQLRRDLRPRFPS
jgi:hypothetical protein